MSQEGRQNIDTKVTLNQVTGLGQAGTLPKSRIVELDSKPNPSDPDVKTSTSISDLHVNLYGDTALVSYKMTSTDTGHKDPALNATDHYGCLDTFVERKGQWYAVGNACSLSEPLPQAEWNAKKKAMSEMPVPLKAEASVHAAQRSPWRFVHVGDLGLPNI